MPDRRIIGPQVITPQTPRVQMAPGRVPWYGYLGDILTGAGELMAGIGEIREANLRKRGQAYIDLASSLQFFGPEATMLSSEGRKLAATVLQINPRQFEEMWAKPELRAILTPRLQELQEITIPERFAARYVTEKPEPRLQPLTSEMERLYPETKIFKKEFGGTDLVPVDFLKVLADRQAKERYRLELLSRDTLLALLKSDQSELRELEAGVPETMLMSMLQSVDPFLADRADRIMFLRRRLDLIRERLGVPREKKEIPPRGELPPIEDILTKPITAPATPLRITRRELERIAKERGVNLQKLIEAHRARGFEIVE